MRQSNAIDLKVTIVEPYTKTEPIKFRRYTIDESKEVDNRIDMIIGPDFEELELGVTTTDVIYGQWYWIVDSFHHLTLFAYIGDCSYEESKERYEEFLKRIPIAAMAVVKGDRAFLLEHEQLLSSTIFVRFVSIHPEFNKTVPLARVSDLYNR